MKHLFFLVITITLLSSCIEDKEFDDVIPESLRITTLGIDTLGVSEDTLFKAVYRDNTGSVASTNLVWSSTDPAIFTVSSQGLVTAVSKGVAYVKVVSSSTTALSDSVKLPIGTSTVVNLVMRSGNIGGAPGYSGTAGSFTVIESGNDIKVTLGSDYTSAGAPNPVIYLSNVDGSISGGIRLGSAVSGSKTFTVSNTSISDYKYLIVWCDSGNVLLGDGEIK